MTLIPVFFEPLPSCRGQQIEREGRPLPLLPRQILPRNLTFERKPHPIIFKHQHHSYFIHVRLKTKVCYFHVRHILAFHKTALNQVFSNRLRDMKSNTLVVFGSESQSFISNSRTPASCPFSPSPPSPCFSPKTLITGIPRCTSSGRKREFASRLSLPCRTCTHRCLASLPTRLGASRPASRRVAAWKHLKKDRKRGGECGRFHGWIDENSI
jgi:hypothetical protein